MGDGMESRQWETEGAGTSLAEGVRQTRNLKTRDMSVECKSCPNWTKIVGNRSLMR